MSSLVWSKISRVSNQLNFADSAKKRQVDCLPPRKHGVSFAFYAGNARYDAVFVLGGEHVAAHLKAKFAESALNEGSVKCLDTFFLNDF